MYRVEQFWGEQLEGVPLWGGGDNLGGWRKLKGQLIPSQIYAHIIITIMRPMGVIMMIIIIMRYSFGSQLGCAIHSYLLG